MGRAGYLAARGVAGLIKWGVQSYQAHAENKKWTKESAKYGILDIDSLSGADFEKFLGGLFRRAGYAVEIKGQAGDFGVDLILERGGRRIAVQAKRYTKSVNLRAVQEVVAGMQYYGCTEAWVVTNSHFARSAQKLAGRTNVNLVDRPALADILRSVNRNQGI